MKNVSNSAAKRVATPDLQWFGLRVRSNFERQVSHLLRAKGIEEYLPAYRARRVWSDRVRELDLPLFPGYVFCRISIADRAAVLATSGVVKMVGNRNEPLPIDEAELAAVRKMVASQSHVEPWPFLRIGQRVLVRRGPLAGIEGILLKVKSSYRLVVSVTLLGRSVASEIDSAYVKPL
ncbi:MAG TPA: UpxY family transcription antiterminator [Bryobacteraceae bacterium]